VKIEAERTTLRIAVVLYQKKDFARLNLDLNRGLLGWAGCTRSQAVTRTADRTASAPLVVTWRQWRI